MKRKDFLKSGLMSGALVGSSLLAAAITKDDSQKGKDLNFEKVASKVNKINTILTRNWPPLALI